MDENFLKTLENIDRAIAEALNTENLDIGLLNYFERVPAGVENETVCSRQCTSTSSSASEGMLASVGMLAQSTINEGMLASVGMLAQSTNTEGMLASVGMLAQSTDNEGMLASEGMLAQSIKNEGMLASEGMLAPNFVSDGMLATENNIPRDADDPVLSTPSTSRQAYSLPTPMNTDHRYARRYSIEFESRPESEKLMNEIVDSVVERAENVTYMGKFSDNVIHIAKLKNDVQSGISADTVNDSNDNVEDNNDNENGNDNVGDNDDSDHDSIADSIADRENLNNSASSSEYDTEDIEDDLYIPGLIKPGMSKGEVKRAKQLMRATKIDWFKEERDCPIEVSLGSHSRKGHVYPFYSWNEATEITKVYPEVRWKLSGFLFRQRELKNLSKEMLHNLHHSTAFLSDRHTRAKLICKDDVNRRHGTVLRDYVMPTDSFLPIYRGLTVYFNSRDTEIAFFGRETEPCANRFEAYPMDMDYWDVRYLNGNEHKGRIDYYNTVTEVNCPPHISTKIAVVQYKEQYKFEVEKKGIRKCYKRIDRHPDSLLNMTRYKHVLTSSVMAGRDRAIDWTNYTDILPDGCTFIELYTEMLYKPDWFGVFSNISSAESTSDSDRYYSDFDV